MRGGAVNKPNKNALKFSFADGLKKRLGRIAQRTGYGDGTSHTKRPLRNLTYTHSRSVVCQRLDGKSALAPTKGNLVAPKLLQLFATQTGNVLARELLHST
jgi:hypothetical protein